MNPVDQFAQERRDRLARYAQGAIGAITAPIIPQEEEHGRKEELGDHGIAEKSGES